MQLVVALAFLADQLFLFVELVGLAERKNSQRLAAHHVGVLSAVDGHLSELLSISMVDLSFGPVDTGCVGVAILASTDRTVGIRAHLHALVLVMYTLVLDQVVILGQVVIVLAVTDDGVVSVFVMSLGFLLSSLLARLALERLLDVTILEAVNRVFRGTLFTLK